MRKSALTRRKKRIASRAHTESSFFKKIGSTVFFLLLVSVTAVLLWLGKEVWTSLRTQSWTSQEKFNLLILAPQQANALESDMYMLSLTTQDANNFVAKVPANLPLSAWKQYGKFRSSAVPRLYEMNQLPRTYLTSQLAWQTGFIEQAVVELSEPLTDSLEDKSSLLTFFGPSTWWERRSQLSLRTQYKIWRSLQSKRDNQIVNVSNDIAKYLEHFPNSYISDLKFLSQTVSVQQGTSVAIVNMTEVNGVGNFIAEILTLLGFRVVHVSSESFEDTQHSRIIVANEQEAASPELLHISAFFPEAPLIVVDSQIASKYRTNYVMVLGEDFREFITGWDLSP